MIHCNSEFRAFALIRQMRKHETQSCSESCVFLFSNPILIIIIIIIIIIIRKWKNEDERPSVIVSIFFRLKIAVSNNCISTFILSSTSALKIQTY